jgi:flagellar protein FliO/FliZ
MIRAAMPLTALVTALTISVSSFAAEVAPAPAPAAEPAPLQLRPEHQTAFSSSSAPATSSSSLPNWILGLLGMGGLAFVAFKKNKDKKNATRPAPTLKVRARAAMGARSSVVVVEVEGQALVLGVTPHTISLLTTLDGAPEAADEELEAPTPVRAKVEAPAMDPRDRLAALLDHPSLATPSARRALAEAKPEPEEEAEAAPRPRRRARLETQARGLVRAKKVA